MTHMSEPLPRKRDRKSRIDSREWLEGALQRLADGGIDNVRIEPLAAEIGVTKGAFYARYANRDALLEAMLEYWLEESTATVIALYANVAEDPRERLDRILLTPFRRLDFRERARMEQAIRLWAHHDHRAAKTMARVDAQRLAYMEEVLRTNGFSPAIATGRAFLIYAYILAEGTMAVTPNELMRSHCRDLLSLPPQAVS
jgi:AcrR family transcriptional regulator